MKVLLLPLTLICAPTVVVAQVGPPSTRSDAWPDTAFIYNACVLDVVATTTPDSGPYTAFLVQTPEKQSGWLYVRNDDVNKSLERGAIIGLLMGAAEANRWSGGEAPCRTVNLKFETERGRRIVVAASIRDRLGGPR